MTIDALAPEGAPPAATLLQLMTGYWASQSIYVAAKLGLADLIAEGRGNCDDLAAITNTSAPCLYRLLRALSSVGVFAEVSPHCFAMTPTAALLRGDTADSMRALGIMYAEEQYRAWGDLLHSVYSGEPAFEHMYGASVFDYLAQNPEPNRVFNEAMTGYTNQLARAVVTAYDFTQFETVVDVAGGYGALLAAILKSSPASRGVLFEQPHVVSGAEQLLKALGLADRCLCVAGDFFAAIPAGGDAYVLEQILHDWDDERCITILRQCRTVMPANGKLLVVELVIPQGNEAFFGKWLDLHMLVMTPGGRERTIEEYGALFGASGFAFSGVTTTALGASVVEALPV